MSGGPDDTAVHSAATREEIPQAPSRGALQTPLENPEFQERVLRLLAQLVAGNPEGYPRQMDISSRLYMSTRTLKRRLRKGGTSFRRIVTQNRMSHAADLLARSTLPTADIAESSCYSSEANFARAFKRWSGVTPSVFRRGMQEAVGDAGDKPWESANTH